jgi:hypothetical protein
VLQTVGSSSGRRVVKFRLWNFATPMITRYVAEKNPKASKPRSNKFKKCKAMRSCEPLDLELLFWIIHLVDDVAYATWHGCCVGTRVTWIWYLLDLDLFFF